MPNQFTYHNNRSQLPEHYQLRTQIYAVEHKWLKPTVGTLEVDLYDAISQHSTVFIGIHAVGCVRLVPLLDATTEVLGPMPEEYYSELKRHLENKSVLVISRLGITRELKDKDLRNAVLVDIFHQIVQLSKDATHWVATLEPVLIRHLSKMGIKFTAVGEPIQYHGKRQVVYAEIKMLLTKLEVLNPQLHLAVTR